MFLAEAIYCRERVCTCAHTQARHEVQYQQVDGWETVGSLVVPAKVGHETHHGCTLCDCERYDWDRCCRAPSGEVRFWLDSAA